MNEELNSVLLSGTVNSPIDMRYDPDGTAYAWFTLLQSGERFEIVVNGQLAERCAEWLQTGARLIVQGRLAWAEDEGMEIVAARVQFIGQGTDRDKRAAVEVRVAQPSPRTRPVVAYIAQQVNAPPADSNTERDPWHG